MNSEGILKGSIGLLEGDCMPQKDQPPCKPKPIEATVLVTKPSEKFIQSNLVDSVRSDIQGNFELKLKPGEYSAFVKYKDEINCTGLICNPSCVCSPISIRKDSITTILLIRLAGKKRYP